MGTSPHGLPQPRNRPKVLRRPLCWMTYPEHAPATFKKSSEPSEPKVILVLPVPVSALTFSGGVSTCVENTTQSGRDRRRQERGQTPKGLCAGSLGFKWRHSPVSELARVGPWAGALQFTVGANKLKPTALALGMGNWPEKQHPTTTDCCTTQVLRNTIQTVVTYADDRRTPRPFPLDPERARGTCIEQGASGQIVVGNEHPQSPPVEPGTP